MASAHPIIAVCGPPGSGKSTFAKALATALDAVVIDMDHYQTFTDDSLDEVIANLSDTTDSDDFYSRFEIPQLSEDLQQLQQGMAVSIASQSDTPPKTVQATGDIVFETHFGRAHPSSGQLIDFLIWLDCPLDIAMARKLGGFLTDFISGDALDHRDQMVWLNQYIQQYQSGVRNMLDIQQRAIPNHADLRLEAHKPIEEMLERALTALDQWRRQRSVQTGQSLKINEQSAYDYLCVEPFSHDFVQLQLLNSSFRSGLFDAIEARSCTFEQLLNKCDADAQGLTFLLDSLCHQKMVETVSDDSGSTSNRLTDSFRLTDDFRAAYRFKDLLKAKTEFSNFLAPDLLQNIDSFVRDEQEFMAASRLFELFDYHRAIELTDDNYQFTKRWMDLTTALTRYEAGVCIAHVDLSGCQRLMDIGGNSGEFVRQICQSHRQIHATVVDLPVVCEVGQDHLRDTPQAPSVEFYPANALLDPLPGHQCVVSFKSILHDWPIEACERFIAQGCKALRKGGEIIIFERGQLDLQRYPMTYGTLSTAMFYRSYRKAEDYRPLLTAAGLSDITIEYLPLETEFHLIRARKA